MYKKGISMFILLLLLVSCSNDKSTDNEKEEAIYTSTTQEEIIYPIKQPVKFNVARGLITSNVDNSLDIAEMELGLMEQSSKYFPVDKFSLQEGQYLNKDIINQWLERNSKESLNGLNPPLKKTGDVLEDEKNSPEILSHVLEQNYLDKNGEIEGMSLAISLNKYYHIRVSDEDGLVHTGEVKVDDDKNNVNDVEVYGKKIANTIIKNIRNNEKIPNVPIYVTLYQEAQKNSIVPGKFLSETYVEKGKKDINKWEKINKQHYAFPSDDLNKFDKGAYDNLLIFKEDTQKYFNEVDLKVTGNILYKNNDLSDIQININTPGLTEPEIVGLIEFAGSKINSIVAEHIPVTIRIMDHKEEAGIVIWNPVNKEVYAHVI